MLKKVLMTMALCAASAMPLVSEAKDNAGAQLPAQAEAMQGKAEDMLKRPAFEDKRIEINLASRLLTLYQGDVGIRMYPVAPGKPDSPTPIGRRKVVEMEINPTWVDPDDPKTEVPSGPDCPLGYRWIGIGGNYGIHGTNVPSSI
ncbi:MAG: L,D-transpeptidase, partial [Dialister sp.]|nr:L,D-transpeptidase [Dialister sp.]